MIRYKLYQGTSEKLNTKGRWYARAVAEETIDTKALAEHMSNHNSPFSAGVIKGILTDMVACIKEMILEGKNVKIDDLAIFSAGLKTKGADTAADFAVAKNVVDVRLRSRSTGVLRTANLNLEAALKEYSIYDNK